MTTIINEPKPATVERHTVVEREVDSGAGWAIAIIILLVVIGLGIYFWPRSHAPVTNTPPADQGTANINVTLPPTSGSGSSDTNTSGGATQGTNQSAQ